MSEANHLGAHQSNLDCLRCCCLALLDSVLPVGPQALGVWERDKQPFGPELEPPGRSFVLPFMQRIAYGLPLTFLRARPDRGHCMHACLPRGLPLSPCLSLTLSRSLGPRSLLGERQRRSRREIWLLFHCLLLLKFGDSSSKREMNRLYSELREKK